MQKLREQMNRHGRLMEVIRFALTGGISFVVEFAALILLKEVCGLDTLIAAPVAFLISVVVNYLLCMLWVFEGAKDNSNAAKLGFLITSGIGLVLNEVIMLVLRYVLGEEIVLFTLFGFTVSMYMVNKVIATLLVMVWNYFTKRYVLKKQVTGK